MGPGRLQQAFVFSLKEDMTEYYRLIAVLEAQLNLDSERAGAGEERGRGGADGGGGRGSEGLTLRRLAVWVVDPLERLKLMATLVGAAAELKVGSDYTHLSEHIRLNKCVPALLLLLRYSRGLSCTRPLCDGGQPQQ